MKQPKIVINYDDVLISDSMKIDLVMSSAMPEKYGVKICKLWGLEQLKKLHESALVVMTGDKSIADRDTFPVKRIYAEKFLAGTLTDEDRETVQPACKTGVTVDQYLGFVAAAFAKGDKMVFQAEGLKGGVKDQLLAASNPETIKAVIEAATEAKDAAVAGYLAAIEAEAQQS